MNGINIFAQPYGDNLGIPLHTRSLVSALTKKIKDIRLIPVIPQSGNLDPKTRSLISRFSPIYPSFCFWYPNSFDTCLAPSNQKRVGYYIFEYTKIPQEFVESINKLDAICTASKWGVQILKENGVVIPCHVVHGGVDHNKFNSLRQNLNPNVYKFLHIGKAENRKNTELVIRSFNEAFKGDLKIRLTLMIHNPHIQGFSSLGYLKNLSYSMKYPIDNIDIKENVFNMVEIYNTHNCGVFPSKAEGIGLPIVEAMSCGLPVIVSENSGITEYVKYYSNSILLKNLVEEPIYDPQFFPVNGQFGTWMTPTKEELIDTMLSAYYNTGGLASDCGIRAEKYMAEHYTWEQAADQLIEVFNGN